MKKKLKLFFLIMMTILSFNVLPAIEANASNLLWYRPSIPDILDIPVYTEDDLGTENYKRYEQTVYKQDSGKLQKIIIPEYSYVDICCTEGGTFTLYEDSNKKNKILYGTDGRYPCAFLPKGEYYICVDLDKNEEFANLSCSRETVNNMMKGSLVKLDKYYLFGSARLLGGWGVKSECGWYDDWGQHHYNQTYYYNYFEETNSLSDKECYNGITFSIFVKDKNSDPIIKPSGTTKDVLEAEANGGTYDSSKSVKKKDTKKPTVKGVKNNKTYKKSVKFKVSDASGIKKVTLNKKKIKISKAKKGYTVKKNGKYSLKVWDKAGNVRTVKFKIKK